MEINEDRLRDALNVDPEFRLQARYWNTQFRIVMHVMRANLNFDTFVFWPDYYRMNGLIAIRFGRGYIVVKLRRNMPPARMHNAQRGIAVF